MRKYIKIHLILIHTSLGHRHQQDENGEPNSNSKSTKKENGNSPPESRTSQVSINDGGLPDGVRRESSAASNRSGSARWSSANIVPGLSRVSLSNSRRRRDTKSSTEDNANPRRESSAASRSSLASRGERDSLIPLGAAPAGHVSPRKESSAASARSKSIASSAGDPVLLLGAKRESSGHVAPPGLTKQLEPIGNHVTDNIPMSPQMSADAPPFAVMSASSAPALQRKAYDRHQQQVADYQQRGYDGSNYQFDPAVAEAYVAQRLAEEQQAQLHQHQNGNHNNKNKHVKMAAAPRSVSQPPGLEHSARRASEIAGLTMEKLVHHDPTFESSDDAAAADSKHSSQKGRSYTTTSVKSTGFGMIPAELAIMKDTPSPNRHQTTSSSDRPTILDDMVLEKESHYKSHQSMEQLVYSGTGEEEAQNVPPPRISVLDPYESESLAASSPDGSPNRGRGRNANVPSPVRAEYSEYADQEFSSPYNRTDAGGLGVLPTGSVNSSRSNSPKHMFPKPNTSPDNSPTRKIGKRRQDAGTSGSSTGLNLPVGGDSGGQQQQMPSLPNGMVPQAMCVMRGPNGEQVLVPVMMQPPPGAQIPAGMTPVTPPNRAPPDGSNGPQFFHPAMFNMGGATPGGNQAMITMQPGQNPHQLLEAMMAQRNSSANTDPPDAAAVEQNNGTDIANKRPEPKKESESDNKSSPRSKLEQKRPEGIQTDKIEEDVASIAATAGASTSAAG